MRPRPCRARIFPLTRVSPTALCARLLDRRATVVPLSIDASLIGVHLPPTALAARGALAEVPAAFEMETERSLAAGWTLLKWAAPAGLCAYGALRGRGEPALAPAAIFAMRLADDALKLHERIGRRLVAGLALPAPPQLRAQDLGELLWLSVEGCALLAALAWAWRRRGSRDAEPLAVFGALFVLLALSGVVLDLAHIAAPWRGLRHALGVAEDGGEMLAASLMPGCAWSIHGPGAPAPTAARPPG